MGCVALNNTAHWIGGSGKTYNYDGLAYDQSVGVRPLGRDLYYNAGWNAWQQRFNNELPMDLRGVGKRNDSTIFLMGGMLDNQKVSVEVLMLKWSSLDTGVD
ncbi:MAG: hypothetical protein ACI8ZN_002432 [Bacteroidia bacterium]|jgi:hypothetical protein